MTDSMSLQLLLRLPASLRSQLLSPLNVHLTERSTCTQTLRRSQQFSTSRSLLARQPPKVVPRKATLPPPKTARFRRSPSAEDVPPPKTARFQRPPSAEDVARAAPKTPPPATGPNARIGVELRRLLESHGQILLYRSPGHASFYFNSYLLGLVFLSGAYTVAVLNDSERPIPWYTRVLNTIPALFFAFGATIFILAPTKLIRSVSLVSSPTTFNRAILRFETKSSVPFVKRFGYGNVFEAPMDEISMDEKLVADKIPYYNVPLNLAEEFTQQSTTTRKLSIRERLSRFNNGLLNIWPILKQDVRRMCNRDGIAYVRVEGRGEWKLDVHHAMLLDEGKPIISSMGVGHIERSVVGKVKQMLGLS